MRPIARATGGSSSTRRTRAAGASAGRRPPRGAAAETASGARRRGAAATPRRACPAPGALSSVTPPPSPAAMPCTTDRPRPLPAPAGFVVKYGSNARARVGERPSRGRCRRPRAGRSSPGASPAGAPAARRLGALHRTSSTPPRAAIASRAFAQRFRSTWWTWVGSARTAPASGSVRVADLDVRGRGGADERAAPPGRRARRPPATASAGGGARTRGSAARPPSRGARPPRSASASSRPREPGRQLAREGLGVAQDRGEHVVEVVGDAARERPERLDLLRLPEPLLERACAPPRRGGAR